MAKLLFLFLLPFAQNLAQDSTHQDPDFRRGLMLYKAAKYEAALKIFNEIANTEEITGKTTAAILFKGKILTEIRRYGEAEETLTNFLEQYPKSRYDDEVRLTLAKVFAEQYDYTKALKEILTLLLKTESSFYINYGKASAEKIALNYIDPDYIKKFRDSVYGSAGKIEPFLLLMLGKVYYQENNIPAAEKHLSELINKFPRSAEREEAGNIYQSIAQFKKQSADKNLIGVLLPLSGNMGTESSSASKEILEGIKFAVSQYNNVQKEKVGLIIRDTQMKPEKLKTIKDEFQKIPGLKSIIGPIFSTEVREALEIFKGFEIPIISPTATDSDLTEMNDFFFQANPPFGIRGKIIAQYIFFVENKRKIAVLTSNDGYSVPLSANFIEEFTRLGGEIISVETYTSNSYDFSAQVSRIAKDSLILEGIYIPISNKLDAVPIITEIVKNKLNVPIYGDQDWLLAKGFRASSGFSNQLIFSSDYFIDYNNREYQELNRDFYKITKTEANRNVLYGYDTAKYLLTVLRNSIGNGVLIKHKMESGITETGFHNNISFNVSRINRFLNIVRYKDDKFELIDKFQAGI